MPDFRTRETVRARRLRNNATEAERLLWSCLSRRQLAGYKFSRQMPVGPFICDFMCREAKLLVEVDGGQHGAGRDDARDRMIEADGYRIVRFWNNEVTENIEGVLASILNVLQSSPPPAPPARGRGAV